MALDMRLVRKGKSEPREGLIRQGKTHVGLGRQYAEALIESGWSSDDTAELEKNVALIESLKPPSTEATNADEAAEPESAAISEAKVFLRRLRNALPRALRETSATELGNNVFDAGERFDRSAKRISAYLTRIRPSVERLDGDLARHFGGKKASELLDKVNSSLVDNGTEDEHAQSGEPDEALSYYELKGRVLEGIEDLNRAGRIAFEGQGEVVGKFNKDILLRARRERGSKGPDQSAASS